MGMQHAAAALAASADAAAFEQFVVDMQKQILQEAESLDGSGQQFLRDRWDRNADDANAGYGITAVLEGGDLLEKAAANVSIVRGSLSRERAAAMSARGRPVKAGAPYAAAALSLVFHAASPLVPTLRADARLFQAGGVAWYGGGCDLTPAYLSDEDAHAFHAFWRGICDRHHSSLYPKYKKWCDEYLYIPARKEHRGIGGLFFDDLPADEQAFDAGQFTRDVAAGILPSWRDIAQRRRAEPFTDEQRQWQLLRRGRYLEFNLLYDRGVRFGLPQSKPQQAAASPASSEPEPAGYVQAMESIMVSAPPLIRWSYKVVPQPGSPEEQLLRVLRQPRDWV